MGQYRPYGNFNLKGKKTKVPGCKCCLCTDLRDKINDKIVKQEIKAETNPDEVDYMNTGAAFYEGCVWDMYHYWDSDISE